MKFKFRRTYIAALHDIIMAAISFPLSMYLRLGEQIIATTDRMIIHTVFFVFIASIIFYGFKLYDNLWGYASLKDLFAITKASTITILIFFISLFLINRLAQIPRSLFIINWLVLLSLLGGPRFLYRLIIEKKDWFLEISADDYQKISVLLIGLNSNTELFLREVFRSKLSKYHIIGILDDDPTKIGSKIHNIKILGSVSDIEKICQKYHNQNHRIQKILLTDYYIDGSKVKNFLAIAHSFGASLAKLPRLTDFKDSNLDSLEIKPLVIEDLLGRPQNLHNKDNVKKFIVNKRVLITGCGGTIGSELTRQIAEQKPSLIILLDICEFNLYNIEQELSLKFPHLAKEVIIADIRNQDLIAKLFLHHKPEIVFHAAALKHVPLVEQNICEAISINFFGTKILADQCVIHHIKMIMISTDKAINPTNIMGASKRAAEIYIQSISNYFNNFAIVRFGNVLGSSGSVIPLFQQQLKEGGPLTVTHPDMVRYFMTVREAVELVLQSSTLNIPDPGSVFVLDMGEPVKIDLLARQIIQMAGLRPDIDIKIVYSGIRKGEKMYEELFYDQEIITKTPFKTIMLATGYNTKITNYEEIISNLIISCQTYDVKTTISLLQKIVPEYKTIS